MSPIKYIKIFRTKSPPFHTFNNIAVKINKIHHVEVLKAINSGKYRGDMKDFVKSGSFSLFRPK
jgi:uncharacterized protein YigE (DUF2233 family)